MTSLISERIGHAKVACALALGFFGFITPNFASASVTILNGVHITFFEQTNPPGEIHYHEFRNFSGRDAYDLHLQFVDSGGFPGPVLDIDLSANPIRDGRVYRPVNVIKNTRIAVAYWTDEAHKQITPVPESATWSLMILGFGMVAAAMRYRNATMTIRYN